MSARSSSLKSLSAMARYVGVSTTVCTSSPVLHWTPFSQAQLHTTGHHKVKDSNFVSGSWGLERNCSGCPEGAWNRPVEHFHFGLLDSCKSWGVHFCGTHTASTAIRSRRRHFECHQAERLRFGLNGCARQTLCRTVVLDRLSTATQKAQSGYSIQTNVSGASVRRGASELGAVLCSSSSRARMSSPCRLAPGLQFSQSGLWILRIDNRRQLKRLNLLLR
jgi:hypothetical protein